MTEHPERRGFDELLADDVGRVSLRHVRPDDARFREACDHLIGEDDGTAGPDRLDRVQQQVEARVMATWPGGIGELPEG